jgi:dihydrolipoamide dehydrogenase
MDNISPESRGKYDYLVIGSGPAGFASSIKAAQLGLKVGIVQDGTDMLGGACLEEGGIPAKSLIHSASILSTIKRHGDLYGLQVESKKADITTLIERSNNTILQLRKGLQGLFKRNNIEVINGFAQFQNEHHIRITGNDKETYTLTADKFLIASGSIPKPLPDIPFDGHSVISSSDVVRLSATPEKIIIVGGGSIGVEFACFFNTIGSEVILVEFEDSLIPFEDKDVSTGLTQFFIKNGITAHVSSKVEKISTTPNEIEVIIKSEDKDTIEKCDVVLVSTGRIPSSSSLGLENTSVEKDDRGYIPVDDNMRTNRKNIWAAGDVIPTPMLANVALKEGEIAALSAADQPIDPIDYSAVPNVVYTEVQVASIGLAEEQVIANNIEYSVGKQPLVGTFKSSINSEREGFIKVIADNKTSQLLGVHIFAREAAELIQGFIIAKKAGLTVQEIGNTLPPNPTFSESMRDSCRLVFGKTERS